MFLVLFLFLSFLGVGGVVLFDGVEMYFFVCVCLIVLLNLSFLPYLIFFVRYPLLLSETMLLVSSLWSILPFYLCHSGCLFFCSLHTGFPAIKNNLFPSAPDLELFASHICVKASLGDSRLSSVSASLNQ